MDEEAPGSGVLRYKAVLLVASSGERIWVVVKPDGSLDLAACIYLMVDRRAVVGSSNTLEKVARNIATFLNACSAMGIDMMQRVRSGTFLNRPEVTAMISRMGEGVELATRAGRLTSGLAFCRFHADVCEERLGMGFQADRYIRRSDRFFAAFEDATRSPSKGDSPRDGLVGEAKAEFVRIIASQVACEMIWPNPFVALRNRAFMTTGLLEGPRRGEILSMRISDIDFETGTYRIERRPDGVDDPRRHQPLVKGYSRTLKMSVPVLTILRALIAARERLPLAGFHDFVFTTAQGAPLSQSTVNMFFRQFRAKHEIVGADFNSHICRHTWNLDFSAYADEMKLDPEKEMKARKYKMGWLSSATAATYTGRHDRDVADQVSLGMQASFLKLAGMSW